jgi:hypothetical protein
MRWLVDGKRWFFAGIQSAIAKAKLIGKHPRFDLFNGAIVKVAKLEWPIGNPDQTADLMP